MAYGLPSWNAGDVLTAAKMQQVSDSIAYLLTPNTQYIAETSGTYVTSSTSWVNIGANYAVSLTTHGGHVLLLAAGRATINVGASHYLRVGLSLDGVVTPFVVGDVLLQFDFFHLWTPDAGEHTIALQWKVDVDTAVATMQKASKPLQLLAVEL
jgi:hypothetical protein